MTAARRFQGLGWFVAGVIMALAFYLVSLGVAAERAKLKDREAAIVQAKRDIRQLQTEFETRANLAQLERWNGEVLALGAPRPEQFVHGVAALAGLRPGQGAPVVQLAAVVVPQGPPDLVPPELGAMPVAQPAIVQPAVVRQVGAVIAAVTGSTVGTVPSNRPVAAPAPQAVALRVPAPRPAKLAAAKPVQMASAAHVGRTPAAVIESALLNDRTLSDLMSGARAETASLR